MHKFLSYIKRSIILGVCITSLILLYQNIYSGTINYPEGESSIAFVLDVSKSMNVADMGSKTRLRAAKEYIVDTMNTQKGYDFSLSIFAGESQRVLPFTRDTSLFSTLLLGIDSANILKQGTNIEDGLVDALAAFGSERSGAVIVLTDGDESEISVSKEIITDLKKQNLEIIIVGFGTKEGGFIPTGDRFAPYKIYNGQRVIAGLNESGLKKLASELTGAYYSYSDELLLGKIQTGGRNKQDYSSIFIVFCILWIMFLSVVCHEMYYKNGSN